MLIADIDTLKAILPTIIGSDLAIYKQALENAEQWLKSTVLGAALFAEIDSDSQMKERCELVVAYAAYYFAIPQLDLVNTPNGFAVAGEGSKHAPASRDRVNALRESILMAQRNAEANLYEYLEDHATLRTMWESSPGTTVIPNSLLPTKRSIERYGVMKYTYDEWRNSKAKHRIVIVNHIAPIISIELTRKLIEDGDTQTCDNGLIIDDIRYALAAYFGGDISTGDSLLLPTFQHIKSDPDRYPEFAGSKQNTTTTPIADSNGIGIFR